MQMDEQTDGQKDRQADRQVQQVHHDDQVLLVVGSVLSLMAETSFATISMSGLESLSYWSIQSNRFVSRG